MDLPSVFRYHGSHDPLARCVAPQITKNQLIISVLPILPQGLLVRCSQKVKEERPCQPVGLRCPLPQARLLALWRTDDRIHDGVALQRFPVLRKQALRIDFHRHHLTLGRQQCHCQLELEPCQYRCLARWVLPRRSLHRPQDVRPTQDADRGIPWGWNLVLDIC